MISYRILYLYIISASNEAHYQATLLKEYLAAAGSSPRVKLNLGALGLRRRANIESERFVDNYMHFSLL